MPQRGMLSKRCIFHEVVANTCVGVQMNFGGYDQSLAFAGQVTQDNSGDYINPILLNSPAPQATVESYNQPFVPTPPVQRGNSGDSNHPVGWASPTPQFSPAVDGAGHVPSPPAAAQLVSE